MTIHAPRSDMLTVLRRLGLTNGLKLCLDAGHETSLPAGSQLWNDLSGVSSSGFSRGDSTGVEGKDPTIVGVAGARSSGEYLSFDGGDNLEYDNAANPAWVETLHKNNAKFSIMAWVYVASVSADQCILCNQAFAANLVGIFYNITNTGAIRYGVSKSALPLVLDTVASGAAINNRWNFFGLTVDEAAGAGGSFHFVNGVFNTFDGTYASPSSGAAALALDIGSSGNSTHYLANGGRIPAIIAHEGVTIPVNSMRAFYQATRGKFGV